MARSSMVHQLVLKKHLNGEWIEIAEWTGDEEEEEVTETAEEDFPEMVSEEEAEVALEILGEGEEVVSVVAEARQEGAFEIALV